jgi:ribonucleotide reductase alpha subunit
MPTNKPDILEDNTSNSKTEMAETMYVVKRTGEKEEVSFDKCLKRIQKLSKDLKINPMEVSQLIITQIYDGVQTNKLDELAAEICAAKTTIHPDYGRLASRIIISNHHKNTSPSYSEVVQVLWDNKDVHGTPSPLVNEALYKMVMDNKEKINATLDYERDFNYDYFGFKTLERAYLLRIGSRIIERPQHMLMRVALGIHKDDLKEALKAYKMMAEGFFTHATPTLFNMGTRREQASSCFLMTIDDDSIDGIYKTLADCAKISKYSGGIGVAIHKIRAKGSQIRGTNGTGDGIVPMLKVFNETARYVNQSGRRAGSFACFAADTEVLTINEGVKKIQDVKIGDLVVTHKNRVKPVIQTHKNPLGDRKIYKLIVEKNKEIYVTGNHKFWSFYTKILKNNKLSLGWNSVEELKNLMENKQTQRQACYISIPSGNDIIYTENYSINVYEYENIIAGDKDMKLQDIDTNKVRTVSKSTDIKGRNNISYSKPVNKIWNITEDFANLIGIWLGDGHIRKDKKNGYVLGIGFTVHDINNEEINYIKQVCEQVFGCKIASSSQKNRNTIKIEVNSHLIGSIFMELFGSGFAGKKLPNMVFSWPKKLINNLIAGLITTDGHIRKNCSMGLNLSNHTLMNQIYHLCRNNGMDVSLTKSHMAKGLTCNHYCMSIPMNKDIITKTHKIYNDDRVQRCLDKKNNDDKFLKIISITETDRNDEYVYTLGVQDDHSYTVEGLLAENCYLEPWHADIEDFLKMRLNTGIEEERARDLFYSLWVSDLFMRRVEADADWTLMCPDKCPGLYLKYGREFEELYIQYEKEGRGNKVVKARKIWEMFLQAQIETGMPYLGFKDAINEKNNQKNLGTIQCSNLCHEICEYTSKDEIAVCNLASVALPKFVEKDAEGKPTYNFEKFREVVKQVIKNLNKVIDYNYYPVKEAENSNRKNRPIGAGVQGLSDTFAMMKMAFDSPEARALNRKIFENLYFAALEASMELARKRKKYVQEYKRLLKLGSNSTGTGELTAEDVARLAELKKTHWIIDEELKLPAQYAGAYSSFVGSPLSEGKLQFDMWGVKPSPEMEAEWAQLRADVLKHGARNSLLIALMPTASSSQILGWNECFEPFTNNIYTRKTLAGTFVVVNKYLINDLLELGLWTPAMKDRIILADGSVQGINEIPQEIRERYKTVWEMSQRVIIDMSADRSAFICQTSSMNLFVKSPTFKTLNAMHFYSWQKKLKTGCYYLRSQAKTAAQKFSVDLEKVKTDEKEKKQIEGKKEAQIEPKIEEKQEPECLMCSS